MRRVLFLLMFLNTILFAQPSGKVPNWDAWNFLMGEWKGEGGGDPGQGTGTFSFAPDLDYTIITRKNHSVYPATKDRHAFTHDDTMTVYQESNATRANYSDNEGHIINYTVKFSPDSNAIIFLSDSIPASPRFRLTYTKAGRDSLKITFDIAQPGKPKEFLKYIEAKAIRIGPIKSDDDGHREDIAYIKVDKFDPNRDAAKDISDAIIEATKSNRRIILDVGGNWCIWCKRLDTLFLKNTDLADFMHKNYVVVKVNFSKENQNEKVLSQYPEIKGYPHLFVLEKDGKILHSEDTSELESGKHHDRNKVFAFLKKWVINPKGNH